MKMDKVAHDDLPKKDEYRTNSIIQEIDIEACEKQDRGLISINDSPNICRVHSNMSSPYELFTSALSIKDADFVCNLNNSEHVFNFVHFNCRNKITAFNHLHNKLS